MLRDWGAEQKYHHVLKGYNFRMEGIQGAVLRVKMRHIEAWTEARRGRGPLSTTRPLPAAASKRPGSPTACRHVYHVYAVRSPERARWQQELTTKGVQTGIHYPIPVHLQPAYADAEVAAGRFPSFGEGLRTKFFRCRCILNSTGFSRMKSSPLCWKRQSSWFQAANVSRQSGDKRIMKIRDSKILVTGGCGLIGSTTIDLLLREHDPAKIVIFDNLVRGSTSNVEAALRDPRVELVQGDIRDIEQLNEVTQGMDAVIHMATLRITACAAEPREALEVMCVGSYNVLEAAQAANVKKVVTASSASIYGLADTFPTAEDHHPYNNRTWYGASKIMLEGLLRSFNDMYGLPYVALRYFNVYGPRMDLHGKYTEVLIRWMDRIASGEPPLILGDGSTTMDFVYIDDIARANVLALQSDISDQVFNVASGTETSLNELAAALLRVMGSNLAPEYGPERKVNPVSRRLADIAKAEDMLGFKATVDLEEGLQRLVAWWRENRHNIQ